MSISEPKTKEDILDRMTRIDFSGDLRLLGENVQLNRLKRHVLQLYFPKTNKTFNLTVHKPRPERKAAPKKVHANGGKKRARKSRARRVAN